MSKRASVFLLPIIYLGFISLGLPDGTLGVAWPKMHVTLHLPVGVAGVLLPVATVLSAISSFNSGRIIARFGTGPVVLVSCILTGSALLIISQAHGLAWLVVAAAPLGFGAGAVDSGLNGFVARHYSGRHMNWLHACWGIGATCGPLIMTRALGVEAGWRTGYLILATVQLSLALLFLSTLRLWATVPEISMHASGAALSGAAPHTPANSEAGWLSAVIFATYVAAETTAGLWASSILVESRHLAPETAGFCATGYYGSITGGRIAVGFVVDRWGNRRLVGLGLALALLGALAFSQANSAPLAAISLVMLGLGFAPVYPCLMHEVPRRFAPGAAQIVIGRQSGAAYIGGASLPALAGWLAPVSLEGIVWIVVGGVIAMLAIVRRLDRIT